MWFSEVSRGFWWQSRLVVGLQASATAPAPALHLVFLAAQGQGCVSLYHQISHLGKSNLCRNSSGSGRCACLTFEVHKNVQRRSLGGAALVVIPTGGSWLTAAAWKSARKHGLTETTVPKIPMWQAQVLPSSAPSPLSPWWDEQLGFGSGTTRPLSLQA